MSVNFKGRYKYYSFGIQLYYYTIFIIKLDNVYEKENCNRYIEGEKIIISYVKVTKDSKVEFWSSLLGIV